MDTATEHFLEEQPTGDPGRDSLGERFCSKTPCGFTSCDRYFIKYFNIFAFCCDNAVNLDTAIEHFLEEQPTGDPGRDSLGKSFAKRLHICSQAVNFDKMSQYICYLLR